MRFGKEKLEWWSYQAVKKFEDTFTRFDTIYTSLILYSLRKKQHRKTNNKKQQQTTKQTGINAALTMISYHMTC